ncbi:putative leucine-rich repeat receptor-like protein kinase [Ananas comosus]|uniref:Putative leucine-rich repeat receptor-like protein kinase n=1 Tax=Ananas comosus TaxID=4615 RepID=A0A199W4M6_ANACO|nr:putative leucine-rich repeat receptor-like protein kinase [Ananas comosus]
MDLEVSGRHALLFDDDAAAAFVGSASALVPWSTDASLLIDRYDVRHLLDRVPRRPSTAAAAAHRRAEAEIDLERYRDLPPPDDDDGGAYGRSGDGDGPQAHSGFDATAQGAYQSVPFSYGYNDASSDAKRTDPGMENSCYRPPFPLAEQYSFKVHVFLLSIGKIWDLVISSSAWAGFHGSTSLNHYRLKLAFSETDWRIFGSEVVDEAMEKHATELAAVERSLRRTVGWSDLHQVEGDHICSFTGTIPDELGNLRQLTFLALNSNKVIGRIPATLGKLSNLSWLDLADN